MDILCLFGLFPDEYLSEIEKDSVCGMQNAANKLQWNIVRGLDQIDDVDVSIANSLYIGSYPKRYRQLTIPSFDFHHVDGANDRNIGFCNLTGFKWFSRYYGIKKYIKDWASTPSRSQKVLLCYALTTPFANVAAYIKRIHPEIQVCFVVPDLPDYMNTEGMNKKGLYYYAKQIEIRIIRRCIRKVDCFVLLTDAMREWFRYPVTYTVVEGIAPDCDVCSSTAETKQRSKTVLYAGGIKEEYGVIALVEAFARINAPGWELVLYGDGPSMDVLRHMTKDCPTIKLMGAVPNSVVVEAQKRASILVNPRKNQVFTKYSFPSKIMEYMASGTPVLAYPLDGMPAEYAPFYFPIQEDTGIESALAYVMGLSEEERNTMGRRARQFVAECKTPKKQCQKIVHMLSEK